MVKVENGNQGMQSFMKKIHGNLWNIYCWGHNKNRVFNGVNYEKFRNSKKTIL